MAETLSLEPVEQPKLDLEPLDLEPVEAKAQQQPANPYLTGWGYSGQEITSPEAAKSFTPLPGVASALEASSEMAPLALLTRGTRVDPIRKAMASEVNKAVGTVLSPGGLAMIPAAVAAPEAMGIAGAALSAPSVVSGAKEAYEGFRQGDWAKAAGGATRAGIGGLVVAGGILPMAMRALKAPEPPVVKAPEQKLLPAPGETGVLRPQKAGVMPEEQEVSSGTTLAPESTLPPRKRPTQAEPVYLQPPVSLTLDDVAQGRQLVLPRDYIDIIAEVVEEAPKATEVTFDPTSGKYIVAGMQRLGEKRTIAPVGFENLPGQYPATAEQLGTFQTKGKPGVISEVTRGTPGVEVLPKAMRGPVPEAEVIRPPEQELAAELPFPKPPEIPGEFARGPTEFATKTAPESVTIKEGPKGPPPRQQAPRPEVPGTPPEPERGMTVLQEIRNAGANTKAAVQQLYPHLSREQAGQLLDQAYPGRKGVIAGSKLEQWADKKIEDSKGQMNALAPDVFAAYAVKGAALLEKGITNFRDWSIAMMKAHGLEIRPYLQNIWREAKTYHDQRTERRMEGAGKTAPFMKVGQERTPNAPTSNLLADTLSRRLPYLTASDAREIAAMTPKEANAALQDAMKARDDFLHAGATVGDPARLRAEDRASGILWRAQSGNLPAVATPPVTKQSNGATTPPPPGSAFNASSVPPEDPIWPVQAAKLSRSFRDWWERVWPRSWAAMRQQPNTAVISEHQRFLFTPLQYMEGFSKTPWWQALDHWDDSWLVEFENEARQKYHERIAAGDNEQQATLTGIQTAPESMQGAFTESLNRYPIEVDSAKELGVEPPPKIEGPYLPRRTTEEGKNVIDVPKGAGNWGGVLRKTLGSFARSRVHDTMKEGIAAGTQYEPVRQAVWMRNLYSHQLEATAAFVRAMKEKGVLYDTKEAARAAGGEANPYQVRGLGGKDFYARNRQEGKSIEQNFDVKGHTPLVQVYRLANTYGRNPNLINPLPHTTKNMFFKYVLARVGNLTFKKDLEEFKNAGPQSSYQRLKETVLPGRVRKQGQASELLKRFDEAMPISESGERLPNLTAKEVGIWGEKITSQGLGLNDWSSKFIFGKADPAMRYSLWKSYVRKGVSDQEAANNVWLDLIRYDENSGGINFWKSMPFNFFVPWRLGTYVTLAKAIRTHPVRSLAFIGAIEYLREERYRSSGRWTHLPVDYLDAPLAEAIGKPSTAPAIAATTLLFGPGGGQAPTTIKDLMGVIHGDPGSRSRALNMFWGLSQIYEIPREFEGYMKDGKASHLVNILTSAALSEHSAIKYDPRRLMKWLPEWMPGMQKSELVRQAEALQKRVQQKQEKGQATYERRHGVGATFERTSEEQQMQELRRAAH